MLLFSLLPMRTISTMNPVLRPIVVCGPSGSGKSTLLRRLIDEFQDYLGFTVSHTTRKPRDGEINGREYHFTEREEMLKAIAEGEFIEHAEFSGNIYGTSKRAMEDVQKAGKICVLDLEIEGVKNMKKIKHLNPLFIFIKAPSLDVLATRLRDRGTDSEESISKRLKRAEHDLNIEGIDNFFDLIIVNDDRDRAYQALKSYIEPVYHLKKRCVGREPRKFKHGLSKRLHNIKQSLSSHVFPTWKTLSTKLTRSISMRKSSKFSDNKK